MFAKPASPIGVSSEDEDQAKPPPPGKFLLSFASSGMHVFLHEDAGAEDKIEAFLCVCLVRFRLKGGEMEGWADVTKEDARQTDSCNLETTKETTKQMCLSSPLAALDVAELVPPEAWGQMVNRWHSEGSEERAMVMNALGEARTHKRQFVQALEEAGWDSKMLLLEEKNSARVSWQT